jgi:hypothetical protein
MIVEATSIDSMRRLAARFEQRFKMFRGVGADSNQILLKPSTQRYRHDISPKSATSAKTPITNQPTSTAFSST